MNKHFLPILLGLCLSCFCFGQKASTTADTLKTLALHEVVVSAFKIKSLPVTTLNAATLAVDSLSSTGNFNLTDMMSKTPGISMLSTGVAIAKPVVRGLYGNRVLVLLSSLKFDNQQWQEEHGLGLSDIGLSKVEVMKGPLSVLYGSEAMGGVISLIEEQKLAPGERQVDASVKMHSNTLGGMVQGGYKANFGSHWIRIRAGVENNADYTDGSGNRVLNSRFDGYYLKTTYGLERKNWVSTNHFSSSFNRFGFIFKDIYSFVQPDERWSRKLSVNPAHLVLLNVFSSENRFNLKKGGRLYFNFGLQSNQRMENEGGGAISLNMHLLTFQYFLKWEKQLSQRNTIILSNLGVLENNKNYGARKIVPNAWMQETNLSAYLESRFKKIIFENGLGAGEKFIQTLLTTSVNTPEKEIMPFKKTSPFFNLYSGLSWLPFDGFNAKFNVSTGVRIPNLAELSSNGLHEGVFTYEIGDPNMKNERNMMFNLQASFNKKPLEVWGSLFCNRFNDYVYLAPTTEDWYGFPVYRYRQQNALQYGGEAGVTVRPTKDMTLGATWSNMMSKTEDGEFTPFLPAQKIAPTVTWSCPFKETNRLTWYLGAEHCFEQTHLYSAEQMTPAYTIWNAGVSTQIRKGNSQYNISLNGSNLLNKSYYDHLSRFKYFGLMNMGRNVTLQVKYSIIHH